MRVSARSLQIRSDDDQWFNCECSYQTLKVSAFVSDHTVYLMAWGKDGDSSHFTLIAVAASYYPQWLKEHRDDYGKVMIIKSGGMEPHVPAPM